MKPVNPVYRIVCVRSLQAGLLALAAHWLLRWPLTGPHALGLFFTPLLCLYFVFVFVAPWSWGLPILTRLPTREKVAALTFDDGPSETTAQILDILREAGVTATFFVLGEAVAQSPDALKRIAREGHAVGIHAYRHRPFVLMSGGEINQEITRTRAAIGNACPEATPTNWLRPPHGFKSLRAIWAARRAGRRLAAWSVDGRDYCVQNPQEIARRVLDNLRPGAVILLHDGPGNAATAAALPLILTGAAALGYRFVRLP